MNNRPEVPRWIYKAQLFLGIILVILALFLYYNVVPQGLDKIVPIILLIFGFINLFFGRVLFDLPRKQKERAEKLKVEKANELKREKKAKEKKKKK